MITNNLNRIYSKNSVPSLSIQVCTNITIKLFINPTPTHTYSPSPTSTHPTPPHPILIYASSNPSLQIQYTHCPHSYHLHSPTRHSYSHFAQHPSCLIVWRILEGSSQSTRCFESCLINFASWYVKGWHWVVCVYCWWTAALRTSLAVIGVMIVCGGLRGGVDCWWWWVYWLFVCSRSCYLIVVDCLFIRWVLIWLFDRFLVC